MLHTILQALIVLLIVGYFVYNILDVISTNGFLSRGVPEATKWNVYFQKEWGGLWFIPKMALTAVVSATAYFLFWYYSGSPNENLAAGVLIFILLGLNIFYYLTVQGNNAAGK